jgi:HK97 family phage portal protein
MSIFSRFFRRNKPSASDLSSFLNTFSHASDAEVGKDATSFAAMDLIASSFAGLSGQFYDRGTRQAVKEHWLYGLVNDPNIDETKFIFFYNSAVDYFSSGNVYYFLYPGEGGEILSMFRLNPARVRVRREADNRKVFSIGGKDYTAENVLHIPARYGYNGLVGKSIFSVCRTVFKNTADLDGFLINSFNNGVGNRLVLDVRKSYPNAKKEDIERIRSEFLHAYAGVKNNGKPLVKSNQMEYETIQTDSKDNRASQLVENRKFQEKETAKLFGVPTALLSGEETGDIESLYTVFIENAIKPLAAQFEQGINRIIPPPERSRLYFEYSYNSLLKTSLQTRIEAYTKQVGNAILTPNEIRRKENLPESEAGDTLFIPANLMPLRQDVVDAYMAGAKIKELQAENMEKDSSGIGDDRL